MLCVYILKYFMEKHHGISCFIVEVNTWTNRNIQKSFRYQVDNAKGDTKKRQKLNSRKQTVVLPHICVIHPWRKASNPHTQRLSVL